MPNVFSKLTGVYAVEVDGVDIGKIIADGAFKDSEEKIVNPLAVNGAKGEGQIVSDHNVTFASELKLVSDETMALLRSTKAVTGTTENEFQVKSRVGEALPRHTIALIPHTAKDGKATVVTDNIYFPSAEIDTDLDSTFSVGGVRVCQFGFTAYPVTTEELATGGRLNGTAYEVGEAYTVGESD